MTHRRIKGSPSSSRIGHDRTGSSNRMDTNSRRYPTSSPQRIFPTEPLTCDVGIHPIHPSPLFLSFEPFLLKSTSFDDGQVKLSRFLSGPDRFGFLYETRGGRAVRKVRKTQCFLSGINHFSPTSEPVREQAGLQLLLMSKRGDHRSSRFGEPQQPLRPEL